MEIINIVFHSISLLLALLTAGLLLFVNEERKHSNRILAFVLIIFAIQNLLLILLFSRMMLTTPWLLRVFAPTTFLPAPLAFLYIRSVLNDEIRFRKYDWLLLIPAFLTIINFIPYYFLPVQEKIEYLNNTFYNTIPSQDSGRGILPTNIYYIIRVIWSAVFLIAGFKLIYDFKKVHLPQIVAGNKMLINWLLTFDSLLCLVLMATILRFFIPALKSNNIPIADILFGASIIFITIQLFLRPRILYGVFQPLQTIENSSSIHAQETQTMEVRIPEETSVSKSDFTEASFNLSQEDQLRYKKIIENYFSSKKIFLQTDYSLEQLVADTHIPRYALSAFINREYGMGFREFLNRYRIDYFMENVHDPLWSNLTLEAIAENCGFSSRSTFINNFKKVTGQTPSMFMKATIGKGPSA